MKNPTHEEKESEFFSWLDILENINNEHFETIEQIMPFTDEVIRKTEHKKIFFILFAFHTHLTTLKNDIIDLSSSHSIYGAKVLYRVFLEHWLKATYIFLRYVKEDNEEVAEEYYSLGRIGEELKYGNSLKEVSIILDAETKNLDVWDHLCKHLPNLRKLKKEIITQNIKKFEYKSIAKYLLDHDAPGSQWIPAVITEYSELSSFVHAGPNATDEYAHTLYKKQFAEYRGMIKFAFYMSRSNSFALFSLIYKDLEEDSKKKILPLLEKLRKVPDLDLMKGAIIENSLKDTGILKDLQIVKSWKAGDWKLHDVLVSREEAEQLGQYLDDGPWYIHFWEDASDDILVVYKDKNFTISKTDKTTWKDAIEYGLSINIPLKQLTFVITE
ncbi:hypothetical protein GW943_01725 [Candidatus Parcubacteria bacterium]|uniref:Uncharacterized protein n=1 Tax=Candidatus Kaiserbacteria bacterium CG10_big_fil_rev_8_21_14_0_10_47_16 TaxID=1974608 RepID=A0A2H0UED0_9BACT|nr:hypothetical protein [Candidatus Parcubacteria bacterium]PIR84751.1 MAG: hypothetical protein COU16_01015 [Candidatus Kaiserbacteria bacterium CG10_big_fil_rev_8_21_14_0_10_47_16]